MILNHINDIAAICAGQGIQTAIISPGSRSAPLTLAFARHPEIETKVIADERAAAFIALGIAQQQQKPVALICTSGSAAFNYAPAVAEAYFQEVPLFILTADRPPEWVNQYDGQTIQQSDIYGKHVKASFTYPDNPNHTDITWHANRMVNEAILTCKNEPKGPVHINIPLREPFYPEAKEVTTFGKVRLIESPKTIRNLSEEVWQKLITSWKNLPKRLIVAGQQLRDTAVIASLQSLSNEQQTPVVSDVIGNLHGLDNTLLHQDVFLSADKDESNSVLIPDLLITFGKSNISKNLKRFIRKHKPAQHWHIQPHERYQDTFQSLTKVIPMESDRFFELLASKLSNSETPDHYLNAWQERDKQVADFNDTFFKQQESGEFRAIYEVINALPRTSQLHLANSMTVRYANYIGLRKQPGVSVFCNRGTSGIDGSNSTALGAALAQNEMVTLITGDMAFFYDRNAFWHKYPVPNLRILLLNNHAGGIFRLIKGPADQPELEEYFETDQLLNAQNTANDFGMGYSRVSDLTDLQQALSTLYEVANHAKILEVTTDSASNAAIFKAYKAQ